MHIAHPLVVYTRQRMVHWTQATSIYYTPAFHDKAFPLFVHGFYILSDVSSYAAAGWVTTERALDTLWWFEGHEHIHLQSEVSYSGGGLVLETLVSLLSPIKLRVKRTLHIGNNSAASYRPSLNSDVQDWTRDSASTYPQEPQQTSRKHTRSSHHRIL